jgi:hypothetical protein
MSTTSAERTVLVTQEIRIVYVDSRESSAQRTVYATEEN